MFYDGEDGAQYDYQHAEEIAANAAARREELLEKRVPDPVLRETLRRNMLHFRAESEAIQGNRVTVSFHFSPGAPDQHGGSRGRFPIYTAIADALRRQGYVATLDESMMIIRKFRVVKSRNDYHADIGVVAEINSQQLRYTRTSAPVACPIAETIEKSVQSKAFAFVMLPGEHGECTTHDETMPDDPMSGEAPVVDLGLRFQRVMLTDYYDPKVMVETGTDVLYKPPDVRSGNADPFLYIVYRNPNLVSHKISPYSYAAEGIATKCIGVSMAKSDYDKVVARMTNHIVKPMKESYFVVGSVQDLQLTCIPLIYGDPNFSRGQLNEINKEVLANDPTPKISQLSYDLFQKARQVGERGGCSAVLELVIDVYNMEDPDKDLDEEGADGED